MPKKKAAKAARKTTARKSPRDLKPKPAATRMVRGGLARRRFIT